MRLADCEMRPGVVLAVCNNYGTVKASCIGLFSEEDNIDDLPPVFPLMRASNTAFCEPQIGDMIWVLFDTTNPQALYYVFQGDAVANNDSVLEGYFDDCEILSRRQDGGVGLQWNNLEGWKMQQEKSGIQIDPTNRIALTQNDNSRTIEMNDSGIHLLSKDGETNPAVLGNELKKALNELTNCLNATAAAGKGDPHTTAMAVALESGLQAFTAQLGKILSSNVMLD